MSMVEAVENVRLFAAVFPGREIADKLEAAVQPLSKALSSRAIRWTPMEQVHLTLAFIGWVDVARVEKFGWALEAVAQKCVPCALQSAGVGCFPNSQRPRILWAGLAGELQHLLKLQKSVEQSLAGLGYIAEDRPFHPHLTLGRVNLLNHPERQILGDFLASFKTAEFGQWQVDKIDLMQSVLSREGAKYTALKSYPLHQGPLG